MPVSYARIQEYLGKIAAKGNASIDDSPHRVFWNVNRDTFVTQNVPHVSCHGQPMPLLKVGDAANSALFLVLTGQTGAAACNKPQMPDGGPLITDPGYQITLNDGTVVTGQQIQMDLKEWIDGNCPEVATNEAV